MKKMFKGILIGLGVIVGLSVVGVMFSDDPEPITEEAPKVAVEKKEEKPKEDPNALLKEMLEKAPAPEVTRDEYEYIVEYTLTNDTGHDFDYIEVEYDVFDKDGVKLANDFTNITEVKDGQSFKVKLDLYQDGADHYEITKITTDSLD